MFQGLVEVLRAVNIDAVILDDHSREALTVLDIHILQKGAIGQLGPGRDVFQVAGDQ